MSYRSRPAVVSRRISNDHGWPVELVELDADHASIAGAGYDSVAGRYNAAEDDESLAVAADVAARIAAVAG